MFLTITCYYPLIERQPTIKKVKINSLNESFIKKCNEAKEEEELITFDRYYGKSPVMFEGGMFPYILKDEHIIWNVPYDEVSVEEFLNTHSLKVTDNIVIEIGNVGGAGELFESLYQNWISFVPILEVTLDWAGRIVTVYEIIKFVRNSFGKEKKDKPSVSQLCKYILKKDKWNLKELCRSLNADREFIENFLIGIGYENYNGIFIKNVSKVEYFQQLLCTPPEELYDNHGLSINCYKINSTLYEVNLNIMYLKILCEEKNDITVLENIRAERDKMVENNVNTLEKGQNNLSIDIKAEFPPNFTYDDEHNVWIQLIDFNKMLCNKIAKVEKELGI